VLLLSPDGRTRRIELSVPGLLVLGLAAALLLCASLWLGWGVGALSAGAG
jgi:hypothetical protein